MSRKPKLKKYPRKPKKSASIEVKQRWLDRCQQIDRENAQKVKDYKHSKDLSAKIDGFIASKTMHPSSHSTLVTQKYHRSRPATKGKKRKKSSVAGTRRYKRTRSRR